MGSGQTAMQSTSAGPLVGRRMQFGAESVSGFESLISALNL